MVIISGVPIFKTFMVIFGSLTLYVPETKIAEFANRVALVEVTHNEPHHLDLHCLPSSL